ncbi:MAG TPA: MFS transporter [Streptosporangiaceae bacterium]|jgi:MFS family permease
MQDAVITSAPPVPAWKRNVFLVLLLAIGIVNYLDRSTLSIANHGVSSAFSLDAAQLGALLSVFSWAYAFAQLPAGPLLDRYGTRWILGGGVLLWSIAQVASGAVTSFRQMIVARLFLGVGEAPTYPGNAKVIASLYPKEKRGTPIGFATMSSAVGPLIGPPLLTGLMLGFGWRVMFVAMGVAGAVLSVAWVLVYRRRDRPLHAAVEDARPLGLREWGGLLRHGSTWGMIFGFMGVIYSIWLYLTWLPAYLSDARHLSIATTGFALIVPYLFGALGMLSGGILGDALSRRMAGLAARKWPVCVGLLVGGLFTVPAALTSSTVLAIACISGSQFFLNMASGGAWTLVSVIADERATASLGSLQNFGGYFGGAFAPLITGFIVDRTGSFVLALLLSSVIAVVAAGVYLFAVRKPVHLPPAGGAPAV